MMISKTPQWVAVYTRSRSEKQVAERLAKAGFEHYLPMRQVKHKWSDRVKLVDEPLIKSYIFVRIGPDQEVDLRAVAGVVTIVSFGRGIVSIIPEKQIDDMRRLVDSERELHIIQSQQLVNGVAVRIVEGPFEGMEGTLVSDCNEGNFAVQIEGLNISLVTKLDKNVLLPLAQKKGASRKHYGNF